MPQSGSTKAGDLLIDMSESAGDFKEFMTATRKIPSTYRNEGATLGAQLLSWWSLNGKLKRIEKKLEKIEQTLEKTLKKVSE